VKYVTSEALPERQPKLLDLLRRAVRNKHYSLNTERTYVYRQDGTFVFMAGGIPRIWEAMRSALFFPTSTTSGRSPVAAGILQCRE
jgi:hypothetical protein